MYDLTFWISLGLVIMLSIVSFTVQARFISKYREKIDPELPNFLSDYFTNEGHFNRKIFNTSDKYKKIVALYTPVKNKEVEDARKLAVYLSNLTYISFIIFIITIIIRSAF